MCSCGQVPSLSASSATHKHSDSCQLSCVILWSLVMCYSFNVLKLINDNGKLCTEFKYNVLSVIFSSGCTKLSQTKFILAECSH